MLFVQNIGCFTYAINRYKERSRVKLLIHLKSDIECKDKN